MHASDLYIQLPVVDRSTNAVEAARIIARDQLAGLVVADESGRPVAVVSSSDVLALMVPSYVLADMSLAGVLDEAGSEEMWSRASDHTIGELLDDAGVTVRDIVRVDADATLLELAAKMADARAQIVVVDDGDGDGVRDDPRFITLPMVMNAILTVCDAGAGS